VKPFTGLRCNGRQQALPTNIRLGWKLMEVANTLAYYDTASIAVLKSFIVQAPGCVFKKLYLKFALKNVLKSKMQILKELLLIFNEKILQKFYEYAPSNLYSNTFFLC
jgi:hypothetical protein